MRDKILEAPASSPEELPDLATQIAQRAERLSNAVRLAGGNKIVCGRIGMPIPTLSNYLSGRDMPARAVTQLAWACNISAAWLLDGTDIREPEAPRQNALTTVNFDVDILVEAIVKVFIKKIRD